MYTWAWGSRGVVDSWAECYRFWSVVNPGDVSHAHNQPGWIVSWGAVVSGLVFLLASRVRFDWPVVSGVSSHPSLNLVGNDVQGVSRVSTHPGAPTVNIGMAHLASSFSYSTFLLK